jgi:cytochrome c peroxidase
VRETFLGRNFGWLPTERAEALRNLGHVIREDDGTGALARAFGGPYRAVLAGAMTVPAGLRLPPAYRIDVSRASDSEILDAVARLVSAYLRSLAFHRDANHHLDGSPYDGFLAKNGLPRAPEPGEPDSIYARRLRDRLERLQDPRFVTSAETAFRLHPQDFVFGSQELRGLLVFLAEPGHVAAASSTPRGMGVGNCVSCHAPPRFTDFGFHNTGASEAQYEAIHGAGAFRRLTIPDLAARNADYDTWLPATSRHPHATGRLRSPPSLMRPGYADLGLWNVLGNPDMPGPQAAIRALLGRDRAGEPAAVLSLAIGCFKTPSLRDLGHSAPYLHSGRADSLEQVLAHYVEFSARARAGTMRNPDARLRGIVLGQSDISALVAFLKSLNEDYE